MEQEFGNHIEGKYDKEKLGRNVRITAIFLRHGEKEFINDKANTGLTEEGRQMSSDFGSGLEEKDAIKSYASDTDRTIDTATLVVNAAPTGHKLALKIKDELKVPFDEKGPFMSSLFAMKKEILGPEFNNLAPKDQQQRLNEFYTRQHDLYLNYGDKRPDESTLSPIEVASRLAERLDIYIRMADRLKSGSKVDLINATHDWAIASFLKEVILRRDGEVVVRGFQSIEDIGGPIRYTEHFDVDISTDADGIKNCVLIFRGQKCQIDFERFGELLEIAKRLREHKG